MENSIHEGECLPWLRSLPSNYADACLADPPYGIGFDYGGEHDDKNLGYIEWLWPIVLECERVVRPGAPLFIWQSGVNLRHLATWFPRDWRLFVAAKNFVQMRKVVMQHAFDPVLVWWKPGATPFAAGTLSRDFHVADTRPQARAKMQGEQVSGHPCPRPLHQVRHMMEQWVPEGGLVLDPFIGSGTTAVAALQSGRRWVGAEKSAAYCAIARERLLAEMLR